MIMKRIHLFEFEDYSWFPQLWRNLVTDYLEYVVSALHLYRPVIPLIRHDLDRLNCSQIVDLASGSSGPVITILQQFEEEYGMKLNAVLTDKFPHVEAFGEIAAKSDGRISFIETSVNAESLPENLNGFRTMFNSFHHFKPAHARKILQDAVRKKEGIGVFELTGRYPVNMLLILLSPLAVLFMTPFIKPFSWKRLLFTYLIPVVPFIAVWDGTASNLRTYSEVELNELVESLDAPNFDWEIGKIRTRFFVTMTYLIGYPER